MTSAGEGRDLPVRSFTTRADWAAWLEREHASSPGVWLAIARKGGGGRSVSYAEALDVALCYGWIDGQKDRLDDAPGCSGSRRAGHAVAGRNETALAPRR